MTLSYQQQFVLDGLAGRAAILNLDARHNRLYSAGDLVGWITTFRHAGATFVRAGESFTDLRKAFDGGDGQRLVTVDHEITVDGVDATQNCVALLFRDNRLRPPASSPTGSSTSAAAGTSRHENSNGTTCRTRSHHPVSEGIRYEFAFGTYEDALRMVGVRTEPRYAGTAVSGARIQHFASMVRDPNPSYWDADFARQVWGGLVAPPALLMGWLIPPPWLPSDEPPTPSIAIRVPLPGTTFINASNDVEFPTTILEGDRLHVIEEVVSVSPEKKTHVWAQGISSRRVTSFTAPTARWSPSTETRCSGSRLRCSHEDLSPAGMGRRHRADRAHRSGRHGRLPTRRDEPGRHMGLLSRSLRSGLRPAARTSDDLRQHHAHRRFRRSDRNRLGGTL